MFIEDLLQISSEKHELHGQGKKTCVHARKKHNNHNKVKALSRVLCETNMGTKTSK